MIPFSCPRCGRSFSLKPEFAGRETRCSACKEPFVVPAEVSTPVVSAKISFACSQCGMKFSVPTEFAGRATKCPTCKESLIVPNPDQAPVYQPALGQIDGAPSSLARAGVNGGVSLAEVVGNAALRSLLNGKSNDGARYVVESELARGGMGAVMRAVDCDIRREVAVKYLLDQSDANKKLRFVEEAQITGQLEHPNIVPIHELGVDAEKRIFFSMKMVKGRSLGEILMSLRSPLTPDPSPASGEGKSDDTEYTLGKLLNIFVNVCNALAYAHSRGVVHRDLKPANIMVGDFGEVYVMDWGLAKVLDKGGTAPDTGPVMAMPVATLAEPSAFAPPTALLAMPVASSVTQPSSGTEKVATSRELDADLTQEGSVLGTPVYMPPEQAAGKIQDIDERSDIYSMGAILYEMLTLQTPISKDGGYWPILMRVSQGQIEPPEKKAPGRARAGKVPPELAAVAMKALAKSKADRYQSVEALRNDIERFVDGRSVSAKNDTIREMAAKFVKRNKGVSIATSTAALILAVVGVWSLIAILSANARTASEQAEKEKRTREAVPAFLEAAQQAVAQRRFDNALVQLKVLLDYDSDNTQALLLKGQLLVSRKEFPAAAKELEAYVKLRPDDADAQKLAKLCVGDTSNPSVQEAIANILVAQKQLPLAIGLLQENEKRLALYRQQIEAAWPGTGNSLLFDSEHRLSFVLNGTGNMNKYLDLTPLQGIPISNLYLAELKISDLRTLRGMPLTALTLNYLYNLKDFPPLGEMPLTHVECSNCPLLENLSGLKGMKLNYLQFHNCMRIKDLTHLKDMPLNKLVISTSGEPSQVENLSPLRGAPINYLHINNAKIADIEPLRKMPIRTLFLYNFSLKDLSPLQGMQLELLDLAATAVNDLSALQGMPLKSLNLTGCKVSRIDALRGMPLRTLSLENNNVRDLTPLQKMRLESLNISFTAVNDLSPLRGMPLTSLGLGPCPDVEDLGPLEGMRLTHLNIRDTKVRNLTPLKAMKLESIFLSSPVQSLKGLEVLREMKSLQTIIVAGAPVPDFWQKLDKGEIK